MLFLVMQDEVTRWNLFGPLLNAKKFPDTKFKCACRLRTAAAPAPIAAAHCRCPRAWRGRADAVARWRGGAVGAVGAAAGTW